MDAGGRATQGAVAESRARDGKLKSIHETWIPATSMDGGSANEDMESSSPIHAGMTTLKNSFYVIRQSEVKSDRYLRRNLSAFSTRLLSVFLSFPLFLAPRFLCVCCELHSGALQPFFALVKVG